MSPQHYEFAERQREANTKTLLLFEPWNLGDLVIAACFARRLYEYHGVRSSFLCKSDWKGWIQQQEYVDRVFVYDAPWTHKTGKYYPFHYKTADIFRLRRELRSLRGIFVDVRGDLRHRFFLRLLTGEKILSLKYPLDMNVYERTTQLEMSLGLQHQGDYPPVQRAAVGHYVALFWGSYWKNKQVPWAKGKEILERMLQEDLSVKLILQPEDDPAYWQGFEKSSRGHIELAKGDILFCSEVVSKARLIVSTDSAWLHMGYYYGVPIVGMFGSLNAAQWAPPGCHVIYADNPIPADFRYRVEYENDQPLQEISIDRILSCVFRILNTSSDKQGITTV